MDGIGTGTHPRHLIDLDVSDWTVLGFDFTFDVLCHVQVPVAFSLPVIVSYDCLATLREGSLLVGIEHVAD